MACELVGFCALNPSEQAAWVQAVFSVIAIVVAILVPYLMERNRRQREDILVVQRARGYALRLLGDARQLRRSIAEARRASSEEFAQENLDEINGALLVPPNLTELAVVLHEVGRAGTNLQDAMMLVEQAKREIDEEDVRLRYAGTEHDDDGQLARMAPVNFHATLDRALKSVDQSLQELQNLFPDVAEPATPES